MLPDDKSLITLKNVLKTTEGYSVNAFIGLKDGYLVMYPAEHSNNGRPLCECADYDPRYR